MTSIRFYRNTILLLAVLSFLAGIAVLVFEFGANLPGSGDNSAAITSSFALIVATVGLVLALHMQSAEYRRETEVVDGLQEIRLLLELVIARAAVAQAGRGVGRNSGMSNSSVFQRDKELLLEAMVGPAGRFLIFHAAQKSHAAKEQPEEWRLLHYHLATVMLSENEAQAGQSAMDLFDMLKSVDHAAIKEGAKLIVHADTIDKLNKAPDNVLIGAMRSSSHRARSEVVDPYAKDSALLESHIAAITQFLQGRAGGKEALAELVESMAAARKGDRNARIYIAGLHERFFAPHSDPEAQ